MTIFYYIEFITDIDTTFFGKFLNMSLIIPDEIDEQGNVVSPSIYSQSLDLLGDEVKWLTNDNTLYITPQIILLSHEEDIDDNGWRTLQYTDYIQINSLLTFISVIRLRYNFVC